MLTRSGEGCKPDDKDKGSDKAEYGKIYEPKVLSKVTCKIKVIIRLNMVGDVNQE